MLYFIKNMTFNRCIMMVNKVLENIGFMPVRISLGNVETKYSIPDDDLEKLQKSLVGYGFELIGDTKSRIIEKIKNVVVQSIHHSNEDLKVNYSEHIESHLNRDFAYISSLFLEVEGITIEKYVILHK